MKFPTYKFDKKCRIVPGPDTPVKNFKEVKELLLSKDLSRDAEFSKDELHFLDGKVGMRGNMVAFQSFPRCGNTFLRRFVEQITGIHTGADMNIQHTFHEAMMGLLGQEHVFSERRIWIAKTHYPLQTGDECVFGAQKMFCVVRNPLDVIPSFAYLVHTRSHSLVPNEKLHEEFPEWWTEWSKTVAEYMQFNHDYIVGELANEIPTYVLRYEDLVMNPEPVLIECFQFLLDVPSIEGTVCEKRIKDICTNGFAGKALYALKNTSQNGQNLNRNKHMYSEQLKKEISTILKDSNFFFGYADVGEAEGDSTNPTAFFSYDKDEVGEDLKARAYGFRKFNDDTLAKNKKKLERKLKRSNSKETDEGGNSCMLESMPQHMFKQGNGLSKLNRLAVEKLTIKERTQPETVKKTVKPTASQEGSLSLADTAKVSAPAVQA